MEEYVEVRCKPNTAAATRSVLENHIVPTLGKMPLAAVERAQVAELHQRLYGTPAVANMAVRILSAMYKLASEWGLIPEGLANPCRSIVKYPEHKRERFLTDEEFMRLGHVLDEIETKAARRRPRWRRSGSWP